MKAYEPLQEYRELKRYDQSRLDGMDDSFKRTMQQIYGDSSRYTELRSQLGRIAIYALSVPAGVFVLSIMGAWIFVWVSSGFRQE